MVSSTSVGRVACRRVLIGSLLAWVVAAIGGPALAGEGQAWLGRRVITKFGAVLRVGKQVIDQESFDEIGARGSRRLNRTWRVEQINGSWLWLVDEQSGLAGWVTADRVVPYEQALDYYTDEIRANPNNAAAYTGRGHIWRAKKEYDIAIADFGDAIRIDPKYPTAYTGRGNVWYDKNEYEKALGDLGEAIRIDPKYALAYNNRGNVWYARSDYDKAIADYGEAIRLEPEYAIAYSNRGNVWYQKKNYDRAIADYSESIRLNAKTADTYLWRGVSWCEERDRQGDR